MADLQCCVNFCCTAKLCNYILSYTHICVLFYILSYGLEVFKNEVFVFMGVLHGFSSIFVRLTFEENLKIRAGSRLNRLLFYIVLGLTKPLVYLAAASEYDNGFFCCFGQQIIVIFAVLAVEI